MNQYEKKGATEIHVFFICIFKSTKWIYNLIKMFGNHFASSKKEFFVIKLFDLNLIKLTI